MHQLCFMFENIATTYLGFTRVAHSGLNRALTKTDQDPALLSFNCWTAEFDMTDGAVVRRMISKLSACEADAPRVGVRQSCPRQHEAFSRRGRVLQQCDAIR